MAAAPFFAVTAPGIAPYTARELRGLGIEPLAQEAGGVAFGGDLRELYRANLHLRTASRVLVRLGEFRAVGFGELRKLTARLPWERYLAGGQPLALRVTCHKSRLYHSDAVAERVAAAVGDRLGEPPPLRKLDEEAGEETSGGPGQSSEPPQLVVVRLLHDICTISIDASGELLHRRGYRLATAKAPLRETLAAALLLASGWADRPGAEPPPTLPPLIDPFCGSGTIAVEAALIASGIAPGQARRFAFMQWPGCDPGLWQETAAAALAQQKRQTEQAAPTLTILASDRDAGAVEMAEANAARAGVQEHIHFACQPVSALKPPADDGRRGWIVTNPPYGLRASQGEDVRNLYAQFGKVLRANCAGWHTAVLSSDVRLLGQLGLRLDTGLAFVNGGIAVRLGRGVVG